MFKSNELNHITDQFTWVVKIKAEAHLDYWINDYFDGMNLTHQLDGTTVMKGVLPDLAAVYGLMLRLRDSGVILIEARIERTAYTPGFCNR